MTRLRTTQWEEREGERSEVGGVTEGLELRGEERTLSERGGASTRRKEEKIKTKPKKQR